MIPPTPADLYDPAGVRSLERSAYSDLKITESMLMQRAGGVAYEALRTRWPVAHRISVVCGVGNNGGDGFVIASLAHADGLQAQVIIIGDLNVLSGEALASYQKLRNAGVPVDTGWSELVRPDVIVDALLGTGLDRVVCGAHKVAIESINANSAPVLSVDVPSGINASTGACMGAAVRAAVTVTFVGLKQGLVIGDALDCRGELIFNSLDIPPAVYETVPATAKLEKYVSASQRLRPRSRIAHKGDYGHVLVIGGAPGYSGAVRMTAEAAARTGAGLVSVGTHPIHAPTVAQIRPELMCHAISTPDDLRPLLQRATVVAVGPGLGVTDWSSALFAVVRDCKQPLVLDADGLNLLADDPDFRETRIITPHLGEASRLLGMTVEDIRADRFSAARALADAFGGVIVLKGAGTIIQAAGGRPCIISEGNPGMASGGMGDILTGVIAGLVAQGFPLAEAASLGACLHSHSADRAANQSGERGLIATDLMPFLRDAVNP